MLGWQPQKGRQMIWKERAGFGEVLECQELEGSALQNFAIECHKFTIFLSNSFFFFFLILSSSSHLAPLGKAHTKSIGPHDFPGSFPVHITVYWFGRRFIRTLDLVLQETAAFSQVFPTVPLRYLKCVFNIPVSYVQGCVCGVWRLDRGRECGAWLGKVLYKHHPAESVGQPFGVDAIVIILKRQKTASNLFHIPVAVIIPFFMVG